jgi:hypothetical protein
MRQPAASKALSAIRVESGPIQKIRGPSPRILSWDYKGGNETSAATPAA